MELFLHCDVKQLENGRWYCPVCDLEKKLTMPKRANRVCLRQPTEQAIAIAAERAGVSPALIGQWAMALAKWTRAGFPTRDAQEVQGIFESHCKPCPSYNDGRCDECGCNVKREGLAVANKISLKTETCPLGKWS